MNKNSYDLKLVVIFLFVLVIPFICNAQTVGGIEEAANKFSTSARSVKTSIQTGILAIAFICAGVGLVGALGKSNIEGEQASKGFIKWFMAAGFFAICWTLMATLFGN